MHRVSRRLSAMSLSRQNCFQNYIMRFVDLAFDGDGGVGALEWAMGLVLVFVGIKLPCYSSNSNLLARLGERQHLDGPGIDGLHG